MAFRYFALPWLILYAFVIVMAFLSVPFIIIWFVVLTASSEAGKWFSLLCLVPFCGGCLLAYCWRNVNKFYIEIANGSSNVSGFRGLVESHTEVSD